MSKYKKHLYWMKRSLLLADKSYSILEIPVGSVIVNNGILISEGWNKSVTNNDVTSHAEIIAIRKANLLVNNYRLFNFDIYVTLEPCLMCLGAILHSRISNLYFGAKNNNFCVSSFLKTNFLNKKLNVYSGFLKKECSTKIRNFFSTYCRNSK